jgi:hypothetical protein
MQHQLCAYHTSAALAATHMSPTHCRHAALLQLASLNCFQDILSTLCTVSPEQQTQVQPLIPILATVAERCANYIAPPSVACPDGRVLSTVSTVGPAGPVLNGTSAAPNMTSTTPNMTGNMTGTATNMTGMSLMPGAGTSLGRSNLTLQNPAVDASPAPPVAP